MADRPSVGIVGAGKVGTVLAVLIHRAGYPLTAICSRQTEDARRLADRVDAQSVERPADVFVSAALTLITTPDDQIEAVVSSGQALSLKGRGVIHTSGAKSSRALSALEAQGAMVGSLHPAYPFSSSRVPESGLQGVVFALETKHPVLRQWLLDLANALSGRVLVLDEGQKPLYHSAMVFTSNFAVTLFAIGARLLRTLGTETQVTTAAQIALLKGTVSNLESQGLPDALTGPLVRGDVSAVAANLDALTRIDPVLTQLYVRLSYETLNLLETGSEQSPAIEQVLRTYEDRPADR